MSQKEVEAPSDGDGRSFVGVAQVNYFAAIQLAMALRLWGKGIRAFRHARLRDLLAMATSYTGSTYPNNKRGAGLAERDLLLVIEAAKARQEGSDAR